MRAIEFLKETGTVGGTTSAHIASVETPIRNGKGGSKPPRIKGTKSVNALDSKVSIFGAVGENQATTIIKR
jgi:hypothetical protein